MANDDNTISHPDRSAGTGFSSVPLINKMLPRFATKSRGVAIPLCA